MSQIRQLVECCGTKAWPQHQLSNVLYRSTERRALDQKRMLTPRARHTRKKYSAHTPVEWKQSCTNQPHLLLESLIPRLKRELREIPQRKEVEQTTYLSITVFVSHRRRQDREVDLTHVHLDLMLRIILRDGDRHPTIVVRVSRRAEQNGPTFLNHDSCGAPRCGTHA